MQFSFLFFSRYT